MAPMNLTVVLPASVRRFLKRLALQPWHRVPGARTGLAGALLAAFLGATSVGAAAEAPAQASSPAPAGVAPRVAFKELVHDFGEIKRGDAAKHSFIFTNTGSQTLKVLEVRPGCGCTTAGDWDKEVAAGKTGSIPLQFNSSGFSGTVFKSATVTFDDPVQSNVVLQLTGKVWIPIDVSPASVVFQYGEDVTNSETRTVRIVNNLPEPIEIGPPECANRAFKLELKTVKPGKEFALDVSTIPPVGTGTVSAAITLKTSAAGMPLLNVQALAIEHQPLMVSPLQLQLPGTTPATPLQQNVTVHYTGAGTLILTNAKVSLAGAEVQMREVQPGRFFQFTVTFPAGAKLGPGQYAELSVDSSYAKRPRISVPIVPAPIPMAAPVWNPPAGTSASYGAAPIRTRPAPPAQSK